MKVKLESWKAWWGNPVEFHIIESPNRKWYYGFRFYDKNWLLKEKNIFYNCFNNWVNCGFKVSSCDIHRSQL